MLRRIHRIYFGFDGLEDPYGVYLNNWRQELPEYEIVHWNADNLPFDCCAFVREAYAERDHAFLSDYFRWWVLREYGGIYLDADVEVISGERFSRIIDDLDRSSELQAVIGIDNRAGGWYTGHSVAAKHGSDYARFMCQVYEDFGAISIWRRKIFYFMSPQLSALYFARHGHNVDGMGTSPMLDAPTVVRGVKIYPQEYFSPMTPASREGRPSFVIDSLTERTALCHHFSCSWHDAGSPYVKAKGARGRESVLLRDLVEEGRFGVVAPSEREKTRGAIGRVRRLIRRMARRTRAART